MSTRTPQVHAGVHNEGQPEDEWRTQNFERFFWNATAEDAIQYLQRLAPDTRVHVLEPMTIDEMLDRARA